MTPNRKPPENAPRPPTTGGLFSFGNESKIQKGAADGKRRFWDFSLIDSIIPIRASNKRLPRVGEERIAANHANLIQERKTRPTSASKCEFA